MNDHQKKADYESNRLFLSYLAHRIKKKHLISTHSSKYKCFVTIFNKMAEGVGFEPTWDCSQTVFKTASL